MLFASLHHEGPDDAPAGPGFFRSRLRRLLVCTLLCVGLLFAAAWLAYTIWVVKFPGDRMSRESIERILFLESPVTYADGRAEIGVFFQKEHRRYVRYAEIPGAFIDALVASEDKHFFDHCGIDAKALVRALWADIRARRIVQGGSTITMQTAENLLERRIRTWALKPMEILYTLRLEAHYSKEEILEFYVNQFHVTGNGRGIGVAAQYFFNKDVGDLDTIECAFIAGALKGPYRYDPAARKSPEERDLAIKRAVERKDYVITRMFALGLVDAEEYEALRQSGVPFNYGRFRYPGNIVMDSVWETLEQDRFREILGAHGIENIATSGFRFVTTIDETIQRGTLAALRRNLSDLETRLSGYDAEASSARAHDYDLSSSPPEAEGDFRIGRIAAIDAEGPNPSVTVNFGTWTAVADREGIDSIVRPLVRGVRGNWAEVRPADRKAFLDERRPGEEIVVSVRALDRSQDRMLLDLEQAPLVQGGLLVLRHGAVAAMAGGFGNRGFNRALDARRQPGSVFKPLLYLAALELNWNILDPLINERRPFLFQGEFYFPRPDHQSPHKRVSMAWAGAKSENLASLWLLYHLCDRLNRREFRDLASSVGLGPSPREGHDAFRRRIRDQYGIVVGQGVLERAAFDRCREEAVTDLIFAGRLDDIEITRDLDYGEGWNREIDRLTASLEEEDGPERKGEIEFEIEALKRNFKRLEQSNYAYEEWLIGLGGGEAREGTFIYERFGKDGGRQAAYFSESMKTPPDGWTPAGEKTLEDLAGMERAGWINFGRAIDRDDVLIEGVLSAKAIQTIGRLKEVELEKIAAWPPYSFDVLCHVREFRVMVGLRYLVSLARELGVETDLQPVLSFPLGSNAVTLLDLARLFETFSSGKIRCRGERGDGPATTLVSRIIDPGGEIIYDADPGEERAFDIALANVISGVLENVVQHGTGRSAGKGVRLDLEETGSWRNPGTVRLHVPVYGKTGTANMYRNATFVGLLPVPAEGGGDLTLDGAYTIASYVGFDDGRPMANDVLEISGATGAMPAWLDVAETIVRSDGYSRALDADALSFSPGGVVPVEAPKGVLRVEVDKGNGLPLARDDRAPGEGDSALVTTLGRDGEVAFSLDRRYEPWFGSESTIE